MRWLQITFVAVATCLVFGTQAQAREEVITRTDPVTGVTTTETIRDHGWHHGWRNRYYRGSVLGAPVVARRGFPRFPSDGQRVWRAGREWRFDASLGQWVIIR